MRVLFFRDHEISGLGPAGADPLRWACEPRGGRGRGGLRGRASSAVPLAPPASYIGPGVGGFMLVGVAYLGYLCARHPRRVAEVGLVHLDEPAETAETGPATGGEATP